MGLFGSVGKAFGLSSGKGENITNPYEADQKEFIRKLQARASGYEPSLAEEQTKQNLGKALNNTVSAIRSSPGLNPALQARLGSQAGQQASNEMVQQGTMAKLAEQGQATDQLGAAIFGAGNQAMQKQQAEGAAENARYGRMGQMIAGGGSAAAAMASDEKAKENISNSNGEARDFLDHLKGKLYEYKDEGQFGEGKHVGIMAQDLEKSPLGRSMVFEENGTKKVDFAKGFGAVLAAVTEIDDKLKSIEGKGKK